MEDMGKDRRRPSAKVSERHIHADRVCGVDCGCLAWRLVQGRRAHAVAICVWWVCVCVCGARRDCSTIAASVEWGSKWLWVNEWTSDGIYVYMWMFEEKWINKATQVGSEYGQYRLDICGCVCVCECECTRELRYGWLNLVKLRWSGRCSDRCVSVRTVRQLPCEWHQQSTTDAQAR